jgi:hypothetical protein
MASAPDVNLLARLDLGRWRGPQRVSVVVVAVVLLAIGFVPLFGGPGYEHALASGLVVPSAAAIATALAIARAESLGSPLGSVGRGVGHGLVLAGVAFATALVHGLRVGFCDLAGGALGFVLTAGFGAVLGGAWGAVAGEIARRSRRKRIAATLLALAAPVLAIAVSVGRFYGSPMIFAFDPFVGYFSGTLYDTVIEAGASLLTYRVGSLASLAALAFGASVLGRSDGGAPRLLPLAGDPGRLSRAALGAVALAVSVGITWSGPSLGHWQTSATIAADLGGRRSGPRCDVVFPDGEREDQIALLLTDCEEQVAHVESILGARGPDRITAFFFRDAADKKRLMGAADTYIAKPWRHEVYLQVQAYPHAVLGHEIAHVVAGGFGRGPFRIAGSLHGLWPNPGLIEGVAVAASPDDDELTDAQWARAMMDLGILPSMTQIFSIDFLGQSSSKSYTLAGAFVRWMLDRRGPEIVRRWYAGEELTALVATSWPDLDAAFRADLAKLALSPEAQAFAKAKFDRPSVFGRRCPHVVDALRRDADRCRDALQIERAVTLYDEVLARDPHDSAARFGRGVTRARYGDEAAGERELVDLAADGKTPRTWKDRSEEALADVALVDGRWDAARERYASLASRSLDEDVGRTLEVKAYGAASPEGRAALASLLIGAPGRPSDAWEAAARLGAWAEATRDPVAEYVLGKNLAQREWWSEAAVHLDRALEKPPATPRIGRELLRQRIVCACAVGDGDALARAMALVRGEASPFAGSAGGRLESVERLAARCGARITASSKPPSSAPGRTAP